VGVEWYSTSAFIDFKKAYDSVRREVLYNILIEFGISRKLVGLIKMSLDETYSRVCIGKNLSEKFYIKNGLKEEDTLSPLLFNFVVEQLTNSVAQEPEASSPHSQQPATGPCPEPVESNPHPPSQSP
jgi:hypothetical protein